MVPNVTIMLLNAVFGHRFRTQPRLLVSLILVIGLFAVTSALCLINSDDWQEIFLYVTIASVVFININAAIFQSKPTLLCVTPKKINNMFREKPVPSASIQLSTTLFQILIRITSHQDSRIYSKSNHKSKIQAGCEFTFFPNLWISWISS